MNHNIESNEIRELSLIEIILSAWKYKFFFFIILISLTLISFVLDYLIPKKNKFQVYLKNPFSINLDVYPSESTLASIIFYNLVSLDPKNFQIKDEKIGINYYYGYFEKQFLARKNLIKFTKANNEKYNLQNYIIDNNISITKKKNSTYLIILPESKINDNFFKEYLVFTMNLTLKSFKNDIVKIQKNKLNVLKRDMLHVYKILENSKNNDLREGTLLMQNISTIMALYKARLLRVNENLLYFENLDKEFEEGWIVDGPNKTAINKKLFQIMKFILPIILSLVIYLLYLLIKLKRLDKKN